MAGTAYADKAAALADIAAKIGDIAVAKGITKANVAALLDNLAEHIFEGTNTELLAQLGDLSTVGAIDGQTPTDVVDALDRLNTLAVTGVTKAFEAADVTPRNPKDFGASYGVGKDAATRAANSVAVYKAIRFSAQESGDPFTANARGAWIHIDGILETDCCIAPCVFSDAELTAKAHYAMNAMPKFVASAPYFESDVNGSLHVPGATYNANDVVYTGATFGTGVIYVALTTTTQTPPHADWLTVTTAITGGLFRVVPLRLEGLSDVAAAIHNVGGGPAYRNLFFGSSRFPSLGNAAFSGATLDLRESYTQGNQDRRGVSIHRELVRNLYLRSSGRKGPAVYIAGGDQQKYTIMENVTMNSDSLEHPGLLTDNIYKGVFLNCSSSYNRSRGFVGIATTNSIFAGLQTNYNGDSGIVCGGNNNVFSCFASQVNERYAVEIVSGGHIVHGYQEHVFSKWQSAAQFYAPADQYVTVTETSTLAPNDGDAITVDNGSSGVDVTLPTPNATDSIFAIRKLGSGTVNVLAPGSTKIIDPNENLVSSVTLEAGKAYIFEDLDPANNFGHVHAEIRQKLAGNPDWSESSNYWAYKEMGPYQTSYTPAVKINRVPGNDLNITSVVDYRHCEVEEWWTLLPYYESIKPPYTERITLQDMLTAWQAAGGGTAGRNLIYNNSSTVVINRTANAGEEYSPVVNLSAPSNTEGSQGEFSLEFPANWNQIAASGYTQDGDVRIAPLRIFKAVNGVNYWTDADAAYDKFKRFMWKTGDLVTFDITLLWDQAAVDMYRSWFEPVKPSTTPRSTLSTQKLVEWVQQNNNGMPATWHPDPPANTGQSIVDGAPYSRVSYHVASAIATGDMTTSIDGPLLRFESSGLLRNHAAYNCRILDMNVYVLKARAV